MATHNLDHRRYPRLAVECGVELRDRFARRSARTLDFGPHGCQLLTARPESVGALLRLCFTSRRVGIPLEVVGQVVWAAGTPAPRAGISFIGTERTAGSPTAADWFHRLLGAQMDAAALGGHDRALDLRLYLGQPPASGLSAEERRLAALVRQGATVAELLSGPACAQALSSMMRRRLLTLLRSEAAGPGSWDAALAHEAVEGSGEGRLSGGFAKPPPDGFEEVAAAVPGERGRSSLAATPRHLLAKSIEALIAGDVALAERMVRRALQRAPDDAALACILAELEARGEREPAGAAALEQCTTW